MYKSFLLVSVGASIGAVFRWLLGLWLNPCLRHFAFGTFAANMLGCFFAGILLAFALNHPLSESVRLLLLTGFLGSLTTFSALSVELVEAMIAQKWSSAIWIFVLHSTGGIVAVFLGLTLAGKFLK